MTKPKLKASHKNKIKAYVKAAPAAKEAAGLDMMTTLEGRLVESYLDNAMVAAKISDAALDAFLATIEEEP